MNEGRVRVLFGSTSMLGTGVNAQHRAVAIHHLDTPWRPSDLAQRDGRAVRKGNEIAKLYADNRVDVIIYAVENRWTRTSSTCCTVSRRSSRSSKAVRWAHEP